MELVAGGWPAPAHHAAVSHRPPALPALALGDRRTRGVVWHLSALGHVRGVSRGGGYRRSPAQPTWHHPPQRYGYVRKWTVVVHAVDNCRILCCGGVRALPPRGSAGARPDQVVPVCLR